MRKHDLNNKKTIAKTKTTPTIMATTTPKTILETRDLCGNWLQFCQHEFMTIIVIWQLRVRLDNIRNSWDVFSQLWYITDAAIVYIYDLPFNMSVILQGLWGLDQRPHHRIAWSVFLFFSKWSPWVDGDEQLDNGIVDSNYICTYFDLSNLLWISLCCVI